MELDLLGSFLAVAEHGSVTAAAARLHLTQPAVTRHVLALERELGLPLFERAGRGMRLTAAGATLRGYARRCSALVDECVGVFAELRGGTRGRLTIAAGETASIAR